MMTASTIISVAVFVLLALIVVRFLRSLGKKADLPSLGVFLGNVITVSIGEYINLHHTAVTEYPGCDGVPLYIICGGVLLGLAYYRVCRYLAVRVANDDSVLSRIGIALAVSMGFPLVEIIGIKLGLWFWLRPVNMFSPYWLSGVWKFYMLFIGSPSLVVLCLKWKLASKPENGA